METNSARRRLVGGSPSFRPTECPAPPLLAAGSRGLWCGARRPRLLPGRAGGRTGGLRKVDIREKTVSVRDADTPFTEIRCRCDSDKEIIALILSDDFVGIEPDDPFTTWDGHEQIELAKARVEEIAAA